MKLWKISQKKTTGHDSAYDSEIVVAAESMYDAIWTYPGAHVEFEKDGKVNTYSPWCDVEFVTAEYLGEARKDMKSGVIVISFRTFLQES